MNFQRNLKWLLVVIVLPLIFACNTDKTSYELKISGGENLPEGAKATITRRRVDSIRLKEVLVDDTFKNGIIACKGNVESVHLISLNLRSADGKPVSPIIIMALEPGKTEINFSSGTDFTVKGGKYSEMLVNPVSSDLACQKAQKAVVDYMIKGFSYEDEKAFKEYYRLVDVSTKARRKILRQVYQQQNDPLAKFLLHRAGYVSGDYKADMKTKEELANQLGDNREAVIAKVEIELTKKARIIQATLDVGKTMKDFKASNLEGQEIQLSEVLKKNKYVLVELWASWCGPCRAEIPHMKRAYEEYHDKGFEIISFSLDDKRKAWEKASIKDGIPWINTSDLLGYNSPIAAMFGKPGVPANWLVDTSTGKIIAKQVRGEALDHKLEKLLK
ncbi:TlpA disulfide reductase family protein [Marinifilum sp. D714]|uniref:TlpA family protein disulfide reductase n=1 Tax=Marinifilum sp. D714 TaxID=2937523 RepID=UPI0027BE5F7A|nr:TlpA disulfide reductase family protein [Marinifilum sp. D714]MDQ2177181.1 TlpA family protein disulfide reductase [Marinifilum sp. D714]